MLYSDKLTSWLKEKKIYLKYRTYTNYCNVIHNHILPKLGDYQIEELNNDILQEFILQKLENGRKDGKGGISFKYAKDIIQILKFTLPFKVDIQLPYHPSKAVEIFEKENQITLINHLQSEINCKNFGILLCIHTGIRIGELCALKWSDINTQNKYRLYYNRVLKELDLPHLKFHALRHTFATRCIECGCDYKSLSELLGHSNVSITMNIYVHPQMELKRKCVELLCDYYK